MARYVVVDQHDVVTCKALGWAATSIQPFILSESDNAAEALQKGLELSGLGPDYDGLVIYDRNFKRIGL